MEPIEYLRVLRRRWTLVLACLLIGIGAAWVTKPSNESSATPPSATSYRAAATLRTAPNLMLGLDRPVNLNLNLVRVYVTTGEVPKTVAKQVGWSKNPALLASRLTVEVAADVGTLTISVTDSDPEFAEAVANGFSEEIQRFLRDSAEADVKASISIIQTQLAQLTDDIAELSERISRRGGADLLLQAQRDAQLARYREAYQRLQDLSVAGAPASPLITLEPATSIPLSSSGFQPPSSPSGRYLFAAVLALLLGVASALVLDRFDTRLRTRREIEEAFDLPVIAEVPKLSRAALARHPLVSTDWPESHAAEGYRALRSALLLTAPGHDEAIHWPTEQEHGEGRALDGRVILIISPTAGDGKTITAANLAACLAETGRTVLILDCDLQGNGIHRHVEARGGPGLTDLPGNPTTEDLATLAHPTRIRGARVVTSGVRHGYAGWLASDIAHVVARARSLADVVILDSSPLLASGGATDLLPLADQVIVVARAGRVRADQAHRMATLFRRFSARPFGVCLIGLPEDSFWSGTYPVSSPWHRLVGHLSERIGRQSGPETRHARAKVSPGGDPDAADGSQR